MAWEAPLDCFEAAVARDGALGGSGTLLDKMLEKDIGSFVLVTLGSSGLPTPTCPRSSSMVLCECGRSIDPFAREE